MAYLDDLVKAKTQSEFQEAYEKEMQRRLRKYKKEKLPDPFGKCICDDFNIFMKAEHAAETVLGETEEFWIVSKY